MPDRRDLPGLALAAVERAAQNVGLRAPDGGHRAPEVSRGGLVGSVADLAGDLAVLDPEEPLAGELEVVALHVDRPRLVADDIQAVVDPGDQRLGRRSVGYRLKADVRHSLDWHVQRRVGKRAAVGAIDAAQR